MAKIKQLTRIFKHGAIVLPDIPGQTPEQVRNTYAATYSELAIASIKGPDHEDGKEIYHFKSEAGVKG
jgi:PRTRC genetic system protein C